MRLLSSFARPLAELMTGIAAGVCPPRCPLCGRFDCAHHALPAAPPGPRCARCVAPLSSLLPDGGICADCRRGGAAKGAALAGLVALGDYHRQPALREWLLALKHGGRRDLARELGWALHARLVAQEEGARAARVLVPVPLHPWRLWERGYDQALALAQAVSRASGWPVVRLLRRTRPTDPQGSPHAPDRRRNVADAFQPRRRARLPKGVQVLLIDDVCASGATLEACARASRRAGAGEVRALVAARA